MSRSSNRRTAQFDTQAGAPSLWPRRLGFAVVTLSALAAISWVGLKLVNRFDSPALPRLLVKPFEDLSKAENSQAIARGLAREIAGQIAKFKDIVTIEDSPEGNQTTYPSSASPATSSRATSTSPTTSFAFAPVSSTASTNP